MPDRITKDSLTLSALAILLTLILLAIVGCKAKPVAQTPPLPPGFVPQRTAREAFASAVAAPPAPVLRLTLAWDYPSNELSGTAFVLHASPSATSPLPWPVLGSTTNLTAQVDMSAQEQYFYVTASNFWTRLESVPGNFLGTPVPPRLVESSLQ